MPKKRDLSADDIELFREAVADVNPTTHDRVAPYHKPPPPRPRQLELDDRAVIKDMLSDHFDPTELETGEELSFCRPGLQHSLLRKLKRGQFSVCAELDLHGLTSDQARVALARFLYECRTKYIQCVRIIHGKGNGSPHRRSVLKGKVNHWLQQRKEVLAFCSARAVDGGTGAVYVLLKRK